ncbi:hypothetical protein AWC38_SpisGene7461 [Stylophora pistillata]|uniref:Uncharacterized protein n=1 Tax=Stylophora pistillata TaxID=50429 RepID=A0A2B4SGV6_STYPI|nr:hypothetical protein AWC38_SpisGene7461 [Stylophora pistillata]
MMSSLARTNDYLTRMARDGTYEDQKTMCAAGNLYNIDIQIVSSLGVGGQSKFIPSASVSAATVYLGHFTENYSEHSVSLEQVTDHNGGSEDNYEDDIDAKSGPDSIVDDSGDTDMTADIAKGLHMVAERTKRSLNYT